MSRTTTPLNDTQIKNAKPKEVNYKLFDGQGLFLLVKTDGSKLWRCKFRFGGTEQKLSELKTSVASGINPIEEKAKAKESPKEQQKQDDNTLTKVFEEWFELKKTKNAPSTSEKTYNLFERDLKPWLGRKSMVEIKKGEIIECLKRVDSRTGGESARRLKMMYGQIWKYALIL